MPTEKINGVLVPYNLSTQELERMLDTDDMRRFVVACEALSYKTDEKAFELLRGYITNKDKYKRLCVLKIIFRHPLSSKVTKFLEESILSEDILFVENGLSVALEYKTPIEEKNLIHAISQHLNKLYFTNLYILERLSVNEDNFSKLVALFKSSESCGQKEVLCDILCNKYLPLKEPELLELFSSDKFSKIKKIGNRKLTEKRKEFSLNITDVFMKDGYVHAKPERGTYPMIYRAAKGVYWDENTESLYYKGKVSKEMALKFISEAMENEYYTTIIFEN